jgi:hypothetical protein
MPDDDVIGWGRRHRALAIELAVVLVDDNAGERCHDARFLVIHLDPGIGGKRYIGPGVAVVGAVATGEILHARACVVIDVLADKLFRKPHRCDCVLQGPLKER